MNSKLAKIGLVLLLAVAGVMGVFWLRKDNEQLRHRTAGLQRQNAELGRVHEQNARTRELIARAADEGDGAARAIHAEVEKVRREIAELEQRAEAWRAKGSAGATALAANRDPEKSLVLVENFRNAGRATPSAAFQTLVWAATKGDDLALASLLTFDRGVREQLERMIAALPEAMRAKYPTAESMGALFFAHLVTGHAAARVLAQDITDAQHATVTIAFERMSAGRPQAMTLGPGGWQLAVTDEMAAEFQQQMTKVSGSPTKK
jgi:hypothetical protein